MSRIRDYAISGPAPPGRMRLAAGLDLAAAIVVAMLGFPFPIVRASVPVPVFVVLIVVAVVVVHFLYLTVTAPILGRTPGLYLTDLGFEGGAPGASRAWRWSAGIVLMFVPGILGMTDLASGVPARMSGLVVGSTT